LNLAIHTSAYSDYTLSDALDLIARSGFHHVEIAADISETRHFEAHRATAEDVSDLARKLRDRDLRLAAIDIGGWDAELCITNLDGGTRKAAVENVKHALSVANDLDCALITAHLWGLPSDRSRERQAEFRGPFLRSISELAEDFESSCVNLNFMPHSGGFIEESDPTVDLVREADHPRIGYTFGTSHTFVIARPDQTAADMIRYAGDTLTHVLISDTHDVKRIIAPPEVKAHEHTVPGSGDVDFPSVVSALREIDYRGMLCVHLISERDRIVGASRRSKSIVEQWLGT
jgi:myo-inositol catabolism protein IolH